MKHYKIIFAIFFVFTNIWVYSQTYNFSSFPNNNNNPIPVYSGCGVTISDGPGNYGNNWNRYITFTAPAGQRIRITFNGTFYTEAYRDYLYGYDGPNTSSLLIHEYSGDWRNYTIDFVSSGNYLTLRFVTDGSTTYSGFTGTVTCEPIPSPPANCNGNTPASNYCHTSTLVCNSNGYCGNTSSYYTPDLPGNIREGSSLFGGSIENNSWISFVATQTSISLSVNVTNCTNNQGIQMGLYSVGGYTSSGHCDQFVLLSSQTMTTNPQIGSITLTASGLTVGNTYYIMIDGFAGDVCDYTIDAGQGIYVGANISPNMTICPGMVATINSSGGTVGNHTYTWNSNPPDPSLSGQTNNPVVNVSPTVTTTYYVNISGGVAGCPDTILSCTITVLPSNDPQCSNDPVCAVDATASPPAICVGQSSTITLTGQVYDPVLSNDFNNGQLGVGWSATSQVTFTNPCGPGPDGSTCLWMGDAAQHPRALTTHSFNVVNGGVISFYLKYPVQTGDPDDSPCEGPDLSEEGVSLQYSTNNGTTWVDIEYYHPDGTIRPSNPGPGGTSWSAPTQFNNWWHRVIAIPPGARTTSTRFRWIQLYSTLDVYDHWGLDSITIVVPPPPYTVTILDPNGSPIGNGNSMTVSPTTTTTYTFQISTGNFTCSDQVTVNVNPTPPVNFTGLDSSYCLSTMYPPSPSVLTPNVQGGTFSGPGISTNGGVTTFNPIAAGVGTHTITYTYYPSTTDVVVFEDDFATDKGWTGWGNGGWQRGQPPGNPSSCGGSSPANKDPVQDHTPTSDNYYAGNWIGGCYENNMATTYWLTSPVINCSNMDSVKLQFWSHSGCEGNTYDKMYLQVFNGSTWIQIYQNGSSSFNESNWTLREYDVSQYADSNANFRVRFGIGPTDGSVVYKGWNIDDFKVTARYVACPAVVSYQTTVANKPQAEAGPDVVVCASNPSTTLTASGGNTYQWSNSVNTATNNVSPSTTTTYYVTVSNGPCRSVDDVTVHVLSVPNLSISGLNSTYCYYDPNDTLIGLPSGGTFSGNGIVNGNEFDPSVAGLGNHTITYNYNVIDTVVSRIIFKDDFDPEIQPGWQFGTISGTLTWATGRPQGGNGTAGNPDPVTDHTQISPYFNVLGQGLGSGTNGGYKNSSNEWARTPAINCSGYTNVKLTFWRYANFEDGKDKAYIDVSTDGTNWTTLPFAQVPLYPQDNTWVQQTIDLSAYADNQPTFYIRWRGESDASNTYSGWNIDDIVVTGYKAPVVVCSTSTTASTTVYANPNADAGNNVSICQGSSTTLNASGGTSYTWSPSTGLSATNISNPIASPSVTTVYTVTVSNGNCYSTDTVRVTVNPLPVVGVTPASVSLCPGNNVVLTATGANTYTWAPSTILNTTTGTTVTATPTSNVVITVTGTDNNNCQATATASITMSGSLVPSINPSNPYICGNSSVILTAIATPGATFEWAPATGLSSTTGSSVTASPSTTTTYTVTASDAGCTGTVTVTVNVYPTPNVYASNHYPIKCQNIPITLQVNGAVNYQWSPSTGLSSTTGSSVISNVNSSIIYTVTGTDANNCSDTTVITLSVMPLPNISITTGTVTSTCAGSSTQLIATGAGTNGTYNWAPANYLNVSNNDTVLAAPTTNTTFTVTGTDQYGCSNTASVLVTVQQLPSLTITPSTHSYCQYEPVAITVQANTTNPVKYTWNPTTGLSQHTATTTNGMTVTLTPTTPIIYTITAQDLNTGCIGTATANVTIKPKPTVVVNPNNPAICAGQSVNLTATGAQTYVWYPSTGLSSTSAATVTASPTSTTTYFVQGTAPNGCKHDTMVVVQVKPLPDVSVTALTNSICLNTGTTTLFANGADVFVWSPTTGLSSAMGSPVNVSNLTSTTTYTVTGTNTTTGCSDTAVITINVVPPPNVIVYSLSPNNSVCPGGSIVLKAENAVTYVWSPTGTLNPSIGSQVVATPTTNTTYTVTGTDQYGCSNTASINVTVLSPPSITVQHPDTVCTSSSNLIIMNAFGAQQYSWSSTGQLQNNQGPQATFIPSQPGNINFTVTGTDQNGCVGTTSFTIHVKQKPSISVSPETTGICYGASVQLSASSNTQCNFEWAPSTGLSSTSGAIVTASPTTQTIYTVKAIDEVGCSNEKTVTVNVYPLPIITITTPPNQNPTCPGSMVNILASGASSYQWSPSTYLNSTVGSSIVSTPQDEITYTVTGTDGNGCTNTATITITLYPEIVPVLTASQTEFCLGESAVLSTTGTSGGKPPYNYSWSSLPNITSSVTVTPPAGNVTYSVTISDNCVTPQVASITLTVHSLPDILIPEKFKGCPPLDVKFNATVIPTPMTWLWSIYDSNGNLMQTLYSPSPTVTYTIPGYYDISLTVVDTNNCSNTLHIDSIVYVYPYPIAAFNAIPTKTTELDGLINFFDKSVGATSWLWDFGDTLSSEGFSDLQNPVHQYTMPGQYLVWLTVTNDFGCSDKDSMLITIENEIALYIPNVFTPDGNGINDEFGPYGIGIDVEDYDFAVYNRWGELLFRTSDINQRWNGKIGNVGEKVPNGVYVYYIIYKTVDGKKHSVAGHVTLYNSLMER